MQVTTRCGRATSRVGSAFDKRVAASSGKRNRCRWRSVSRVRFSVLLSLCSVREEKQWPLQFGRDEQVSRAETALAIFSADSASLKPVWAVGGAVALTPAINRPASESQGPRGVSVIGQLQRVSTNSAHLDSYRGGWGAPEPRTPRPLGRPIPNIGV